MKSILLCALCERWVGLASNFTPVEVPFSSNRWWVLFSTGGAAGFLNGGWGEAGDRRVRAASDDDEGGRSWANVVGGQPRQPLWTANKVSDATVDQLRRFFTKILQFPEDEMDEGRGERDRVALLARSLGRRVLADWIARDFKTKGKLPNDVLAEDHLLSHFTTEEERDTILRGGPLVVAGQLLAMEPWVPDFVPGTIPIKMTMVWMRLPGLPIEFWSPRRLLSIVNEAGNLIAIDDFTEQLKEDRLCKGSGGDRLIPTFEAWSSDQGGKLRFSGKVSSTKVSMLFAFVAVG